MLYDWGRVTSKVDSASATQRKLSEAVLVARDDAALDIVETYLDVLAWSAGWRRCANTSSASTASAR